ncbi:LysE family translocator [Acrocarpospora catenulata]|uniref:LysE family translocator n=1 Tax=Acrocarpospora catenulata TaxID=2836182 RepID=UPI001BD99151|nr:LysE family translocator [Acrocarpospora catenulata]
MLFLAFVGSCVLLAMIPGVSTAVIIRQTLRDGRASGVAATLGNETGIFLWAMAAVFGLSTLLLASEAAYHALRVVGAVALVVMGVQSIRQARRGIVPIDVAGESHKGWRRAYGLGLATCGANPKAAVFAMSFLPQFVPAGAPIPATLTLLAVVWVLVDTLWYLVLIWLVQRALTFFARPAVRRTLERISGTVLIALGARLALETR